MNQLVGHGIAADLPKLWQTGIIPKNHSSIFDTMVAAHFQGHRDIGLADLVAELFHQQISSFDLSMLTGQFPSPSLKEHNSTDVLATKMLYEYFKQFSYPLSFDLDMKFIPVLAGMGHYGIGLDQQATRKLVKQCERRIHKISMPINPNSSAQVCAYLGTPNAQVATLEACTSLEAKKIVEYKKLGKQVDYLEKFLASVGVDGRIHPFLDITGTVTGRLACSKPPLHSTAKTIAMRSLFIPNPGNVFVIFDFDAGEYTMAARLSGDADLIDTLKFQNPHAYIANKLGISYANAKIANFAALNNGDAETVAHSIGITLSAAQDFIDNYPLAKWARYCIRQGQEVGYTSTPLGRTRGYTKPTECVTMFVQGGLAEVGKAGAVRAKNYPCVMNEHDEYIWEVPQEYALESAVAIKSHMENNPFGVKVTGGIFNSWGHSLIKKGMPGCGQFV